MTITEEEQYTQYTPETETITPAMLDDIQSRIIKSIEDGRANFILDLQNVTHFDISLYAKLGEINHIVMKENGILIVASFKAANMSLLNDYEIVATNTLSEASDYIFMEELERGFLDEGEDLE